MEGGSWKPGPGAAQRRNFKSSRKSSPLVWALISYAMHWVFCYALNRQTECEGAHGIFLQSHKGWYLLWALIDAAKPLLKVSTVGICKYSLKNFLRSGALHSISHRLIELVVSNLKCKYFENEFPINNQFAAHKGLALANRIFTQGTMGYADFVYWRLRLWLMKMLEGPAVPW